MTVSHLAFRRDDSREVDRRMMVDAQGSIDDSRKIWRTRNRVSVDIGPCLETLSNYFGQPLQGLRVSKSYSCGLCFLPSTVEYPSEYFVNEIMAAEAGSHRANFRTE